MNDVNKAEVDAPEVVALRSVVDELLALKWSAEKQHPRDNARIEALRDALQAVTRHIARALNVPPGESRSE